MSTTFTTNLPNIAISKIGLGQLVSGSAPNVINISEGTAGQLLVSGGAGGQDYWADGSSVLSADVILIDGNTASSTLSFGAISDVAVSILQNNQQVIGISDTQAVTIGKSGGTQTHQVWGTSLRLDANVASTASFVVNNLNTGAAGAALFIDTDGTGDAWTTYGVNNLGTQYSIGIDNSDSDILKITNGSSPSAGSVYFEMETGGEVTLLRPSAIGSYGPQTYAILELGGSGSVTGLTSAQPTCVYSENRFNTTVATTGISGFTAAISTMNTAGTTGYRAGFRYANQTKGAASTITRDIAYYVQSAPTQGSTGNALFSDNIAFSSTWAIHLASTSPSLFGGNIGVGGQSPTTVYGIVSSMSGAALTGADIVGVGSINSVASTATSGATSFYSGVTTSNNSFTCARLIQLWLDNNAKGAASTITRRVGALIEQPTDGTNNAALVLGQATLNFTGTWNVYSDSTQPSRFGGGSFIVGSAALSTSATDGFLYIPTCAGAPTGVPTSQTGTVAMVFDTTNNRFYIYDGGWISVALA